MQRAFSSVGCFREITQHWQYWSNFAVHLPYPSVFVGVQAQLLHGLLLSFPLLRFFFLLLPFFTFVSALSCTLQSSPPHFTLCFGFHLQVVTCVFLGWSYIWFQYEMFSYRTHCSYAKHFNCNLKCTYQLKTKHGHIKTGKSRKDEVLYFSYFLPKFFLHTYLKLAFQSGIC